MDERAGTVVELAEHGRRTRRRDGRVLVLVATLMAAAGAAVLADSRPDAVVESGSDAARRETVALDDDVALAEPSTTVPAVLDPTTTTSAAPSTTAPDGPETTSAPRSTAPRVARIASTPTTAAPTTPTTAPTTTTTVDPHPYQPNVIYMKLHEERIVAGEEGSVWFGANGIQDRISYDYGDGSPVTSYEVRPFCNAYFIEGQIRHTWTTPGRYTVTLRMHGSADCETRPDRYQDTTSTLTIDVVAPG